MIIFEAERAYENYRPQLQAILINGEEVETRGRKTKELLNVATIVHRPWDMCILVPGRKWNPWLALSEGHWLLSGRNDIAPLLPFNKNIANYSDDGLTMYGAYGYRIKDQVPHLIERLRKDPNDRRAVLSIWRPEDLTAQTRDPPCNDMVMFKLRQNKLHMTVINRSNDLHWGLYAVNLPEFAMLQCAIAGVLNVDVGIQTHISNSLHIYTDEEQARNITRRMIMRMDEPLPEYPTDMPVPYKGCFDWEFIQVTADTVLENLDKLATFMNEDWKLAERMWRG